MAEEGGRTERKRERGVPGGAKQHEFYYNRLDTACIAGDVSGKREEQTEIEPNRTEANNG